jgi:ABC-2 type transport system permease protein
VSAGSAFPGGQAGPRAPAGGTGRSGVIHDIGYRSYDGPRLGRAGIVRALTWHSLRSAVGLGRGAKAKIIPVLALALLCLPAVANAVSVAQGGTRVISYDTYVFLLRVFVVIIFIAAQAPELVSRDLRSHVLPLYFSRPLGRLDYPLAKLAAFILACLALVDIPLLLLYLGTIAQARSGTAVWAQTRALIPGLAIGLLWAALLGTIGLLLASLSGRRAYATGSIAIYFFLSWMLATVLHSVVTGRGPLTGGTGGATPGARLTGLVSPFTTVDGVRQWLGGTSPGPVPPPGRYGPLYGAMLLALLLAAAGGLALRYRKAAAA